MRRFLIIAVFFFLFFFFFFFFFLLFFFPKHFSHTTISVFLSHVLGFMFDVFCRLQIRQNKVIITELHKFYFSRKRLGSLHQAPRYPTHHPHPTHTQKKRKKGKRNNSKMDKFVTFLKYFINNYLDCSV